MQRQEQEAQERSSTLSINRPTKDQRSETKEEVSAEEEGAAGLES